MNLTKILSIVLFLVSLGLAAVLYFNINSTIEFKEHVRVTEDKIKDKLAIIRESEKAYLERYGKYTASWDTLINFIENGKVPITVRTEKITQLSYGEEKVEVKIDTIGIMSAKDRIFKKSFTLNATNPGTFGGFLVKEGDYVAKRSNAYRLRAEGKTKNETYQFTESGNIVSLAKINAGDEVKRGQLLVNLWEYHLNPDVDIQTLSQVPGSDKNFEIFVGSVKRGNVQVSVIEVRDPSPINPERKASNEAKNRQPLGFGSRVDVSTSGNWE
jgi:biotin carboxyl carrier protein